MITVMELKELMEYFGFRDIVFDVESKAGQCFLDDEYIYIPPPDEVTFLPVIFKYMIPKLSDKGYMVELLMDDHYRVTIYANEYALGEEQSKRIILARILSSY